MVPKREELLSIWFGCRPGSPLHGPPDEAAVRHSGGVRRDTPPTQ
jgi:hypothetical protein